MKYGAKVSGRLVAVPEALAFTKPGDVYEIKIDTDPIADEAMVAQQLLTLEQQVADLQVLYIETCPKGKVWMQFTDVGPGSISISGLVSLIPHIFIIVGIVVVGIMLWQVVTTSPILIWLLALAGGAVIFYSFIGKGLGLPAKIYEPKDKEKKPPKKLERLESRRKVLKTQKSILQGQIGDYKIDKADLEKEIEELREKKPRGVRKKVKAKTVRLENVERKLQEKRDKLDETDEKLEEVSAKLEEMKD